MGLYRHLGATHCAQVPRIDAYADQLIRSIRRGCCDRILIAGQAQLRRVLSEYIEHHHGGRSHQGHGMANDDPRVLPFSALTDRIHRRQRLGGLLNEYQTAA